VKCAVTGVAAYPRNGRLLPIVYVIMEELKKRENFGDADLPY
jgi:hypothetical protein